jgi:hypothetical protein
VMDKRIFVSVVNNYVMGIRSFVPNWNEISLVHTDLSFDFVPANLYGLR